MPKVSVVIPVYNVEAWLPDCLDSVLHQSLQDIEIICIDDASPDRCPAILDDYASRYANIQVIHLTENRRQGYGRNRGMDLASGEYIYFLDSDDMITPESMEELCRLADRDCLDGIFFDSVMLCEDPSLERFAAAYPAVWKKDYPEEVISGQELFAAFMRQQEWTCYVQRQFWRLDFLRREKVRFPDGVEHEDELFAFEAILLAERVRLIHRPYFIRRYRKNSVLTTPPTAKNFHGYFMNSVLMDGFLAERGITLPEAKKRALVMYGLAARYYQVLHEKENMTAWFRERELPLYRIFEASMQESIRYRDMRDGLEEQLRSSRKIYIYGAGAVAETAYKTLEQNNYIVEGFLVSRKENNPAVLHCRPVLTPDEVRPEEGAVILTAMTKLYEEQVRPGLESSGWTVVSFRG